MKLTDNTYIGEKIKKPEKIIKKLNKGNKLLEVFVVVFAPESNRLEVISSKMFLQKTFREIDYCLAALVSDEAEAFEYIRSLTDISYKLFNDINLKRAFEEASLEDLQKTMFSEND